MGGFDSYSRSIDMNLGRPMLGDDTLPRIQVALMEAAPAWSKRARITRVGRWPQSQRIDMTRDGALEAAIRAVLIGGSHDRHTIGDDFPEPHIELAGTERSVHLYLGLGESLRATRRWSGQTDTLILEANKRIVGDEPNAAWIRRVFESLCRHVQPAVATASTLGERVSSANRYGSDSVSMEWLTFFGSKAVARLGSDPLLSAPAEEVIPTGEGVLLVLSEDPGPGRTVRYWRRVEAVQTHLDEEAVHDILRRRRETEHPMLVPQERPSAGARPSVRKGWQQLKTSIAPTKSFADTQFTGMGFTNPGASADGYQFERCTFDNVSLGSDMPARPVTLRKCELVQAKAWAVYLRWVIAEDCTVDGFDGDAIWPVDTLLLRRVVLKGVIGAVDIRDPRQLHPGDAERLWVHRGFYAKVDWALDIRQARFRRADLSGIPGRLIRRDPETQVLVTLDRLRANGWKGLDFRGTAWEVVFEGMVRAELGEQVLVAEPRGLRFDEQRRLIDDLRRRGIAEPD